jgi:hypothetical protein
MANNKNFRVKNSLNLAENLVFEGSTEDGFETTVEVTDPTADQTITFPDNSGEVVLVDSVDGGIGDTVWVIGQPQFNGTNLGKLKIWSMGDTGTFSGSVLQYSDVSQIYATYSVVNYFGQSDLHIRAGGNGVVTCYNPFYTNDITLRPNQTLSFEGSTNDDYETELTVVDPTADRTITFPDATGTVALEENVASTGKAIAMAIVFG